MNKEPVRKILDFGSQQKKYTKEDPFGHRDSESISPELTNLILQWQGNPTDDRNFDRMVASQAYRLGFVTGIDSLLAGSNLATDQFTLDNMFKNSGHTTSFNRGLQLESPNTLYYVPFSFDVDHYQLGFMLKLVYEHAVFANGSQLPFDSESFNAFNEGRKGNYRRVKDYDFTWHNVKSTEGNILHEQMYRLGLQMWLSENSYNGVAVDTVRHPEALYAFKTAIEGRELGLFDPEANHPRTVDLGDKLSPDRMVFDMAQAAYNQGKAMYGFRSFLGQGKPLDYSNKLFGKSGTENLGEGGKNDGART